MPEGYPIKDSPRAPGNLFARLSNARKIAFGAGTLLLLVLIWAILLEGAIRLFDIGPEISLVWGGNFVLSENEVLKYELAPGTEDGRTTINQYGMRDRDYPIEKPPNTLRIAVIGDSIAYGFGLRQTRNFSAQLEGLIANFYVEKDIPKVEILNFGVTGYSFAQVMETLRSRAMRFEPDLVVYAYSLNDPQEWSVEMASLLPKPSQAERDYLDLEKSASVLRQSRLYQLTRYLLTREKVNETEGLKSGPAWNRVDPQIAARKEGRLPEFFAELNTANATWQPVADGLDQLAAFAAQEDLPIHTLLFPLLVELVEYPIPEVHDHLEREFRKRLIPTVDLADVYSCYVRRHGQDIAVDTMHPNAFGHTLTAVALLRHLIEHRRLPGLNESDFMRLTRAVKPLSDYAKMVLDVEQSRHAGTEPCADGSLADYAPR